MVVLRKWRSDIEYRRTRKTSSLISEKEENKLQDHNIMLLTDSYKFSHYKQYPAGTETVYSYLESRGGQFEKTVFFGLQYFLKKYLAGVVVTQEKIDYAEKRVNAHLGPGVFNREGWQHILDHHEGKLPVRIKAVPEGTVVDTHNVLMTVENTDPKCFWLTNYLETLLVQVWYPTTVATLSREIKKIILAALEETGDPSLINFKLHDFGFRGVSSVESAGIGGAAHLVNFLGTDTFEAVEVAKEYYGEEMAGFSIPASEHSTITSWGKDHEVDAMSNMLTAYPTGLVACVSDSFDIYKACAQYWGTELKDAVLGRDGTLVVRPDSGDALKVLPRIMWILGEQLGYTVNAQGYKVLDPHVRVIQGDGVDIVSIPKILRALEQDGWSADNIAFGSGGALLQKLNRDTQKFAFKCSYVVVNGEERDVYKQPVDEPFKVSKKGRLMLLAHGEGKNVTFNTAPEGREPEVANWLKTVFENGEITKHYTYDYIRIAARVD